MVQCCVSTLRCRMVLPEVRYWKPQTSAQEKIAVLEKTLAGMGDDEPILAGKRVLEKELDKLQRKLNGPKKTANLAKWRTLPGGGCWSFYVAWLRIVVFFKTRVLSLFVCLVVLPTRLSARCFPSFRPDTASIRSCLLLPPGFLDTREAGICAGSRAWSSSFFLVWFLRNVSSSGAEIGRFCNYVKLFFGFFHISRVFTVLDHSFWARFGALENTTSCCS